MKRFSAPKTLKLLFPLVFMLVGFAAAWALDGDELCQQTSGDGCCCCQQGVTPKTDGFPDSGNIPGGSCGQHKTDCACDNTDPAPESALRPHRFGRFSESPDFAHAFTLKDDLRSGFVSAGSLVSSYAPKEYPPQYFLHNRSLLC